MVATSSGALLGALAGAFARRASAARAARFGMSARVCRVGARQFATARRSSSADEAVRLLSDDIRTPANDERQYRVVELKNGLQALIASDPTADAAGAALTVRCGTFQDPDDRLGLAHFHEHMLFLGTEKFPKEDEYTRYLSEHGGDSNAFTMNEYTTYHFKVASPHLEGALDRFAQFFVKPLFEPSCVEREMNAVDSESTNYSTEDGWRMLQVVKATTAEQHPFNRFDVGNLGTLGADNPPGTRSELIDWNQQHYQAGAMRLAVVGRESVQELEDKVISYFSPVRHGDGIAQGHAAKPWSPDQQGYIISCVPLRESRSISVAWPLPPQREHRFAKPEIYISHVLGHEGEGSLHDILNMRGWVDTLSAGAAQSFNDQQLLAVNISLTPEGDAHREEVIALLFHYVDLVREAGPQEETFREIAALQEISFAHKEESPAPDDFAASAAMAMHKFPVHEALRGPFAVDEWRPDVIADYLGQLQPDTSLVFLTSTSLAEEAGVEVGAEDSPLAEGWQYEQWYGAPFKKEKITKQQLASWKELAANVAEELGMSLPAPNEFIPKDFSLRQAGVSSASTTKMPLEVTPPGLISSDAMMRLWHKADAAFRTPRAYLLTKVNTPAYELGPEVVTMMRLFCNIVYDDLNAFAYDASVAGLSYGFEFSDSLSVTVAGFNHKLPTLLKVVMQRFGELLCELGDEDLNENRAQELLERIEVQRQIVLQDYKNLTREDPWSISSYYASQINSRGVWHLEDYIEVLEQPPSRVAMSSAVRKALANVQIEVLAHGNIDQGEAEELAAIVVDAFRGQGAEPLAEAPKRDVLCLKPGGGASVFEYNLAAENPAQENCCTQNIYQVGPLGEDAKRDACNAMVAHIASTSCYEQLRTQEQLGYIVQAGGWGEQFVLGFQVLVQGNRLHPRDVDERIESWLLAFEKELEAMPDEEFQNHVAAVTSQSKQRYATLAQETLRHWSEIQPRRYCFDRVPASVATLEALCKDDILAHFREYVAASAPSRRKLSMRVLGTSAGDERTEAGSGEGACAVAGVMRSLKELREFKSEAEFFPAQADGELPPLA